MADEYVRPQEQYREEALLGEIPQNQIQVEWNGILDFAQNPNVRTVSELQAFYKQLLSILLHFVRRYPQIDLNRVTALLKFAS